MVSSQVLRVGWYRLRATFGRRWGGYLGLVLLIGLAGGVALGSAAAARQTESSFPVFLASTNPSDLSVEYASASYAGLPAFARAVTHLPQVRRAEIAVEPMLSCWGETAPRPRRASASASQVATIGSVNGLYFSQDRVTVIRGRMADPRRSDQVVMSVEAARLLGLQVGAVVPMGFYTNCADGIVRVRDAAGAAGGPDRGQAGRPGRVQQRSGPGRHRSVAGVPAPHSCAHPGAAGSWHEQRHHLLRASARRRGPRCCRSRT